MISVVLSEWAERLSLEVFHPGNGRVEFTTSEVNRPGLQLAGVYEYFAWERLQVCGMAEWGFVQNMEPSLRQARMDALFKFAIPAMILCRGFQPSEEMMVAAVRYNRPLLGSPLSTGQMMHDLFMDLENLLAPAIRIHGVLMDIYGMGVLLTGDSGVGKSETALELIRSGHRLVADDVVDVRLVSGRLDGAAPQQTRHFIEIRGIGIIDVRRLFGVGAVLRHRTVNLVIRLEEWSPNQDYDRMGSQQSTAKILGVDVPQIVLPVKIGRNIGAIVEVAVRNRRMQSMGYDAAQELIDRAFSPIDEQEDEL